MKANDILMPTVPKIMLYIAFFFISPALFTVCNGTCSYKLKFLAGLMLLNGTAPTLKLPMIFLLFAVSYLAPSLLVAAFNYLKEKNMMLE